MKKMQLHTVKRVHGKVSTFWSDDTGPVYEDDRQFFDIFDVKYIRNVKLLRQSPKESNAYQSDGLIIVVLNKGFYWILNVEVKPLVRCVLTIFHAIKVRNDIYRSSLLITWWPTLHPIDWFIGRILDSYWSLVTAPIHFLLNKSRLEGRREMRIFPRGALICLPVTKI